MPIPAIVGAALVGGGASLLGGALNSFGQKATNRTNVRLAKMGQQFELDMWNRNNLYNSPPEQMKRLIDAGLNPNLIYSGGSSSTGLSSSYPRAHVAQVQNELSGVSQSIPLAIGQFMDIKMKQAQIDAINNNAEYTLQKTINESIRGQLMSSQTENIGLKSKQIKNLLPYQAQGIEANLERLRLQNQDLGFKVKNFNPANLNQTLLKNASLTQQVNELNPALLQLRQLQSSMMKMNLDFESGLKRYNMTSNDSYLWRVLAKLIGTNYGPQGN